nr:PREDICTED: condensin complex subunit 2 [Latimeria chalumnae]|eukprot:XP_014339431.1 PREDICTED: condensin complex subunit 2 [Latimeria chalumnae]
MSVSTPGSTPCRWTNISDSTFVSPSTQCKAVHVASTPVLQDFPRNNDEQERKWRRRSRVLDLQLSDAESPATALSPADREAGTPLGSAPKLSNAQISDHYSTCIKLSTENKITTKNAFGLHLIDYLADILKQKDSELTNFKMAAGTLDASAKIYAVRVDAVHADLYRVLGGLGKDKEPAEGREREEEGAEDDHKAQKKPRKKRSYNTIEQNLHNINRSEAESKCEIDPLFQKTVSSFDEGCTAGVFLSNLCCYSNQSELLLGSSVQLLQSNTTPEPLSEAVAEDLDLSPLLQSLDNKEICPSLANFLFTQWDGENDQTLPALVDKLKKSAEVFDINAEPEVDQEAGDHVSALMADDFDADVDDDGGALGGFTEERAACMTTPGNRRKEVDPLTDGDIGSMCLHVSLKAGEYSYFSPRTMSMWGGPDHWRFKPRHKLWWQDARNLAAGIPFVPEEPAMVLSTAASLQHLGAFLGSEMGQGFWSKEESRLRINRLELRAVRLALAHILLNVHSSVVLLNTDNSMAATTYTKSALEKWNKKKTTLPADFHYNPEKLFQLNLKPSITLRKVETKSVSSDEGIGEYDYNNLNDTSNFCPGVQDGDGDDDDDNDDPGDFNEPGEMLEFTGDPAVQAGADGLVPSEGQVNVTTYGEDNLVAEPHKVNKIEVHYAKTAKKMDMKRLKQTMWALLEDRVADGECGSAVESTERPEAGKDKIFSRITKELLHRLPTTMAQNLSVPLAFVSLLHLANEKNLQLVGLEDMSDILIKQGK